jgi:acetyl-CoA C-acetyltransferase
VGEGSFDIRHRKCKMVETLASFGNEPTHRCVGPDGCEQLNERTSDGHHHLLDTLRFDPLSMQRSSPIEALIILDCSLQVTNGDGHVIEVVRQHAGTVVAPQPPPQRHRPGCDETRAVYHQGAVVRRQNVPAAVITSIARTPIGRFSGAFAPLSAMELGGVAISGALERANLTGDQVDEVVFGHVIQAGQGQITARQAARLGGVPMTVPATTINKVCLSGMAAVADATRRIMLREATFVAAGGMESMTNAPYVVPKARSGLRLGDGVLVDAMQHDGLFCSFDHCMMGDSSDRKNRQLGIDRLEQDEWAAESHARAILASDTGEFSTEIVPVTVPQRRGETTTVARDEGLRPGTTPESLAKLAPAFISDGTITAGNASQISDGAAALIVADKDAAVAAGLPVLAEIVAYGQTAGPDASLHERPAEALSIALKRAGLEAGDLDTVEINEAFAAVSLWSARMLDIPHSRVNVNGGAVALGHPLGATGARIVVTLINTLRHRGGGLGGAALCGGGGQGDAIIVKVF